jgi:uncharacterized iron-regulated protein
MRSTVDGRSGATLTDGELAQRLAESRVILVGEQHAEPVSMAAHVAVLDAVARVAQGRRVAVAVEWLPHSTRLAAAGWVASNEGLESLRTAVDWERVWGHDFAAYAPVLTALRGHGFALVPVNAEPGLARLVARHGKDGVPDDRKAELPPLDSGNDAHRKWFFGLMREMAHHHGGHAASDETLGRMYLAQLVWDETMAARVSELTRHFDLVIVLAGQGHIGRGFGIPERLEEGLPKLVILPSGEADDAVQRAKDEPFPEREADIFLIPGR